MYVLFYRRLGPSHDDQIVSSAFRRVVVNSCLHTVLGTRPTRCVCLSSLQGKQEIKAQVATPPQVESVGRLGDRTRAGKTSSVPGVSQVRLIESELKGKTIRQCLNQVKERRCVEHMSGMRVETSSASFAQQHTTAPS